MRYIQRALDIDYDNVAYPLLALPKYNGVFCYNDGATPLTRENNIINNVHIREKFKKYFDDLAQMGISLEHEIIISGYDFNKTSGIVRSADNPEGNKAQLVILDKYVPSTGFKYRYAQMARAYREGLAAHADVLLSPFELVQSPAQARAFTQKMVELDDPTIEGAVFRGAFTYYKEGRSTLGEACFLRDKAEQTVDGKIVDIHESVSQEGVPKGMAHSATVIMEDGSTTDVSMTNNLTDDDRRDMYQNPAKYLGKWVQFITNGCAGMPYRHSRFDLWRPDKDDATI